MTIEYKYDKDKDALYASIEGAFNLDEFKVTIVKIVNSNEYPPDIRTLWDMRRTDFTGISYDLEKSAIYIREQYPKRAGARLSFVAESDLAYGMLRMYETLSDDLPQEIKVFRKFSEAEEWLLKC